MTKPKLTMACCRRDDLLILQERKARDGIPISAQIHALIMQAGRVELRAAEATPAAPTAAHEVQTA